MITKNCSRGATACGGGSVINFERHRVPGCPASKVKPLSAITSEISISFLFSNALEKKSIFMIKMTF